MNTWVDEPKAVRMGEEPDQEKLDAYLRDNVESWQGILEIRQFPSGFSNLTYLLRSENREYVLRRPPMGSKVKAAHDMHREYRVLSALHPVYPAAPKPILYCEDPEVIGAPFYLMERIRGIILRGKKPDAYTCTPAIARQCCHTFVEHLATLHEIDYIAAGLADLRREGAFVRRQVEGWVNRYHASQTDDIPAITQLAEYLNVHCPEDTETVLIHNDYKFDNLVFDSEDITRIIGVLDWEMCTVGDPLLELGVALSYWNEPKDMSLGIVPCFLTLEPGCMTRREVVQAYAERTGRNTCNILYYYLFGLFKLAVIAQQIYYRFKQGFTRDERFGGLIYVVGGLGITGINALEADGI